MDSNQLANLSATTSLLFQKSASLFWAMIPVALLIAMLSLYVSGEMSGGKLENLIRRLIIAIAALVAFPQISQAIQGIEVYLVDAFGGDTYLAQIFSKLGDTAASMKQEGATNWLKIGQLGLNIITTLSFLILAVIREFLDMLHLSLWNLFHVLGPIALIGCLFPNWSQVPKGVFVGMLELALWKPTWVILARLLVAVGFGQTPGDVSKWFDAAVLNFAVAGLMASTPILVHSFLSGSISSMGSSVLQTMASGAGAALAAQPMRLIQKGVGWASGTVSRGASLAFRGISSGARRFYSSSSWNRSSNSRK